MILTVPRLLVTTLWVLCGWALSMALRPFLGAVAYFVGFPLGFSGAVVVTWAVLLGRILLLFPFPTCGRGKCNSIKQYKWRSGTIYGWEKGGRYRYRCRCGREYVRKGRRFMEVGPNGAMLPYKKLVGFREWADDVAE
jgi:hypothetical protein